MNSPGFCSIIGFCFVVSQISGKVSEERIQDRRAVVIENEKIRIATFPGGGYIGEVRFKSEDPMVNVNPMRVPHYSTIDPQDYEDAVHNPLYGSGGDRKIMAGYMGHFLCFPYTGGLSQAEKNQGLGAHGEAAVLEWNVERDEATQQAQARGRGLSNEGGESMKESEESVFEMSVDLPITKYRIERTMTVLDGESVVYVKEKVENRVTFDRPFQWVQHTTFGAPFVEHGKTFVDAPAIAPVWNDEAALYTLSPRQTWPNAVDYEGNIHDLRAMEAEKGEGTYWAWLLDDSGKYTWFTMYNSEFRVLIGYLMEAEWNPWIGDWQENKFKSHVPWNNQAVARGILIGTSPFTGGIRRSLDIGPLHNRRTVRWIGASETLSQNYLIFLAVIPEGYQGTESLSVIGAAIHLKERNTNRLIAVKAAGLKEDQG